MAPHDAYRAQVELLIRCLPAVANAPDFALKGGTAINLFLRNMPRLSVDIDVTYLPITDREKPLTDIRVQLTTIGEALRRTVPGVNLQLVQGDGPSCSWINPARAPTLPEAAWTNPPTEVANAE